MRANNNNDVEEAQQRKSDFFWLVISGAMFVVFLCFHEFNKTKVLVEWCRSGDDIITCPSDQSYHVTMLPGKYNKYNKPEYICTLFRCTSTGHGEIQDLHAAIPTDCVYFMTVEATQTTFAESREQCYWIDLYEFNNMLGIVDVVFLACVLFGTFITKCMCRYRLTGEAGYDVLTYGSAASAELGRGCSVVRF